MIVRKLYKISKFVWTMKLAHELHNVASFDCSFLCMDTIKKNEIIFPNLFNFVKENKAILIIISHNFQTLFPKLDHIILLEKGTIRNQGTNKIHVYLSFRHILKFILSHVCANKL